MRGLTAANFVLSSERQVGHAGRATCSVVISKEDATYRQGRELVYLLASMVECLAPPEVWMADVSVSLHHDATAPNRGTVALCYQGQGRSSAAVARRLLEGAVNALLAELQRRETAGVQ